MLDTTPTTLASFYKGWDRYQQLLVEAIAPLTPEQLALQAAPTLRPVWALAAHIVACRAECFHQHMGEGGPEIAPLVEWDYDGQPVRNAPELVRGLENTWRLAEDCLNRWTPADLAATFPHPRRVTITRQYILWHILEHDLHHGGELFFTLGMCGLPTPDL